MADRRAALAACAVLVLAAACSSDDAPAPRDASTGASVAEGCEWPMYGQNPARTFALPDDCDTAISPETVGGLGPAWFFTTDDVVTATPAVTGGSVYVGDWSGVFYAIDAETGEERWRAETEVHPTVYSGQIVSSAAVAQLGDPGEGGDGEEEGDEVVVVGAGKSVYAFGTADGDERWRFDVGSIDAGDSHDLDEAIPVDERPTEVQSSPVIVDGTVLVGFDGHDRPGFRGGLLALDAATGELLWDFDPDDGDEPTGCGGVWSSPSVDRERGLAFVGTANCPTDPDDWDEHFEAIVAVDLASGEPRWSFQPQEPYNNNDYDFAGAPNLFTVESDGGERDVVGLGSKDGRYYVVDRDTGEPVWDALGKAPDHEEGVNFSFGGFIGATAVADGVVTGGTAGNGPTACPCMHAFDAATGEVLWQAPEPQPIYGAAAVAGGVVFAGGTDFTLRALDLRTGAVLWSTDMPGVVAGGAAVVGDDVFAVAGIREPGTEVQAESAGVGRFTLDPAAQSDEGASTTTTAPAWDGPVALESPPQPCVGEPCDVRFSVPAPPDGLEPSGSLVVDVDPFSIRMDVSGLGEPGQWVAPGAPDAADGADEFALMISVSDEQPIGAKVCTFEVVDDAVDDSPGDAGPPLRCEGSTIPLLAPQYNRLSIIALPSGGEFPSVASGVARLVWTFAFDTPLALVDPPPPGD